MQTMVIRKIANAFISNATPSAAAGREALASIQRFKRKHAGLWIGGVVELSQAGIFFRANELNEEFHVGLEPIQIPMTSIRSLRREFGWISGIVIVEHQGGEFLFRCFGAKGVVSRFSSVLHAADARSFGGIQ